MANVYILFSSQLNKFYIGSCNSLEERLEQHRLKLFPNSFTAANDDWELFFDLSGLEYEQARQIEKHIKLMKSKKYIENLKKYPEISDKLKLKYVAGSSR